MIGPTGVSGLGGLADTRVTPRPRSGRFDRAAGGSMWASVLLVGRATIAVVPAVLQSLRAICGAFPEVSEQPSHGAPTWFVRGKKSFATAWLDGHHEDGFPHLWCAAPPGVQEALVSSRPVTFFRPPYVGHRGWLGVRLDRQEARSGG